MKSWRGGGKEGTFALVSWESRREKATSALLFSYSSEKETSFPHSPFRLHFLKYEKKER